MFEDIVEEAVECLCDTLFECNSRICIYEDEAGNCCEIPTVFLRHDYVELPSEEKSLAREEQDLLIQCDWLRKKGLKEIPTCVKIYCKSKLCVEVYEVQKEVGRTPTMKHDTYGFCFRIATSLCDELELNQWQKLLGKAQNYNLQSVSSTESPDKGGKGIYRL